MLASIEFDDEALFGAKEIDNVTIDCSLTAELETAKLAIAQVSPKLALGICRVAAQFARMPVGAADRHGLA